MLISFIDIFLPMAIVVIFIFILLRIINISIKKINNLDKRMKIYLSMTAITLFILVIILLTLLLHIELRKIIADTYSINESQTGKKFDLYCNTIKVGMTHEYVNAILSQYGEFREQRYRESDNYLEVRILYINEEINEEYGRIIIAYKYEKVYSIFASAGWDGLLPYCKMK